MTQHRYPCTAEPPELMQPNGPAAAALGNHRHACIHDAAETGSDWSRLMEHQCECGMTWRANNARPAPDVTWITMENADGDSKTFRRFILPIFATVMIPLVIIGTAVLWLVTR